ncbi:hypothetical protein HK405_014867 [Cladochytrium tenue]|nr:hypothetical protein HK405_014867 [Cladochytrium tenue]
MYATDSLFLPSGLDNNGKVHPLAMSPLPLGLPCSGLSPAAASVAAAAEPSGGHPDASSAVLARLRAPIRTPRLLLHPLVASSVTADDADAVAPAVLRAWLRDFAAMHPPARDFTRNAGTDNDDGGGCTSDADPQSTTDPACLWVVELKDLEGASRSRRPSSPPAPDLDDLASVDDDAATATSAATTSAAAVAAVAAAAETASPLFIGLVELRFPSDLLSAIPPSDTAAVAAARKSPAPTPGSSPHLSVRSEPPLPRLPRLSTPHLASVLDPTFAGCGYATEAVRASLLHIFDSDAEWAAASAAPGPGQPAAGRRVGAASALSVQIAAFRAQFAAATAAATASRLRGAVQDAGGSAGADEEDTGGGDCVGDDTGASVDSTDDGACPQVLPPLKVVTTVNEQRADGARARTVLERLGFELASPTAGEPAASLSLRRGGRSRVVLWEVSRASFLELWSPAC